MSLFIEYWVGVSMLCVALLGAALAISLVVWIYDKLFTWLIYKMKVQKEFVAFVWDRRKK